MANLGRYACVAIPFLLTLASLIALLVAGLAGVTDKSLFMFQVNTTDLSVNPSTLNISGLASDLGINVRSALPQTVPDINLDGIDDTIQDIVDDVDPDNINADDILDKVEEETGVDGDTIKDVATGGNVTAADLGLYDLYDISLWGYCYTPRNGSRTCTKTQFNWAEKELNSTANNIEDLVVIANAATGKNITLPKEISDAINVYTTVSRWTQIVFIIACVALGVELFFGIFANCSRAFSCVTALVAGFATVAVCATAALATATAAIIVGALEASAAAWGVQASMNTRFLASIWIAAAFAIAAGFFWLLTCCCCAPDHSSRGSRKSYRDSSHEKLMPGGSPYQPVAGGNSPYPPQYGAPPPQNYATYPAHNSKYEPYSHANV